MRGWLSGPIEWASLFVVFYDFERLAKESAHSAVAPAQIRLFEKRLRLGDTLWCTARFWGPPTVFVFTDAQAAALSQSASTAHFVDHWFTAAKLHDEFGYLTRDEVFVAVDSKENLDRNYEGSLYYYFK